MDEHIKILLAKYANGQCTAEEAEVLKQWYESLDKEEHEAFPDYNEEEFHNYALNKYEEFQTLIKGRKTKRVWLPRFIKAAASVVVLIGIGWGTYVWQANKNNNTSSEIAAQNDLPPGHDGAVLTLADGRKVVLGSARSGNIAQQGNTQIINHNGQLSYNNGETTAASIAYNTLSTPKARQYKLVLPDGTKVWLNAASSIKYPVVFSGKERKVEITGEAYFEIKHNAAMPFKVAAGKMLITDIGTDFNVSAYEDESTIKTTLLEGAVKVNGLLLKPGQQAQTNLDNKTQVTNIPDPEDVIAWKNGEINFDNVDVATLMRQLSRWYNVDIIYTGKIPQGNLFGGISRQTNLSIIMKALQDNNIHCRLEGNKLMISGE